MKDTEGAWKITGRGRWEECVALCEETPGCTGGYYWGDGTVCLIDASFNASKSPDFVSMWRLKTFTDTGDTCYLYAPGKSSDATCEYPKLDGDTSTFAFECSQGTYRI